MLRPLLTLGLLVGMQTVAAAQCYIPYVMSHHHGTAQPDTATFRPGRFGLQMGAAAFISRRAVLGGVEVAGTYRLAPCWQTGLNLTYAFPTRIAANLGETQAAKPMLSLFSGIGQLGYLLTDNGRLRTTLLAGAGLSGASLSDRSQQVPNDTRNNCGCDNGTHPKTLATVVGGSATAGVGASYKFKPDLWLTGQLRYQQWLGTPRVGTAADLSAWLFGLGLTMPDRWKR